MTTATIDPFAPTTEHPVLIEYTETHLVWITADTAEEASRIAEKDITELFDPNAAPVDRSTGSVLLDEDLAYWLDTDEATTERLDEYFAAHGSRR